MRVKLENKHDITPPHTANRRHKLHYILIISHNNILFAENIIPHDIVVQNYEIGIGTKGLACTSNTTFNRTTDNVHSSKGGTKREKNFSEKVHSTDRGDGRRDILGEAGCEDRTRIAMLTLRLLMSYIYGAPILDVSRSHTTTQHSR